MARRGILGIFLLGTLGLGTALGDEAAAKRAALEAAETWLALVDAGKYAESWEEAAGFFRGAVREEDWDRSMRSFRAPLGKMMSRKLRSRQYATSLPGAPDGEYVVLQFESSFEKKKAAVETVTPMLDRDGAWRVSGYYIK